MRHLKAHRKLGRTTEHRISLLRNLATSLINARDERIVTTLPKAKELRPFVERAITLSRKAREVRGDDSTAGALHLRRQAASFFHAGNMQRAALTGKRGQLPMPRTAGVSALRRLFDELGERYKDRPGGYTRILKLGRRAGDNAELAIIELVDNPREREAVENAKKRARSAGAKKKTAKGKEGKGTTRADKAGKTDKAENPEKDRKETAAKPVAAQAEVTEPVTPPVTPDAPAESEAVAADQNSEK
jgi:large subunit ribosomal protein L17